MNDLNVFRMDQIFTPDQLQRIGDLYQEEDAVRKIHAEVVLPNMDQINRKTGQENDPMFIAYVCVYAVSEFLAQAGEVSN